MHADAWFEVAKKGKQIDSGIALLESQGENFGNYLRVAGMGCQFFDTRFNSPIGLKNKIADLESYDTVFVGTPNWWSTIAPPIAAFLTENNLSGKTIVPFCTHGGGGLAKIAKDITKLCPNSTVLSSFDVYGRGSASVQADVASWLNKVGLKH